MAGRVASNEHDLPTLQSLREFGQDRTKQSWCTFRSTNYSFLAASEQAEELKSGSRNDRAAIDFDFNEYYVDIVERRIWFVDLGSIVAIVVYVAWPGQQRPFQH